LCLVGWRGTPPRGGAGHCPWRGGAVPAHAHGDAGDFFTGRLQLHCLRSPRRGVQPQSVCLAAECGSQGCRGWVGGRRVAHVSGALRTGLAGRAVATRRGARRLADRCSSARLSRVG
jgi:hypothetical protein